MKSNEDLTGDLGKKYIDFSTINNILILIALLVIVYFFIHLVVFMFSGRSSSSEVSSEGALQVIVGIMEVLLVIVSILMVYIGFLVKKTYSKAKETLKNANRVRRSFSEKIKKIDDTDKVIKMRINAMTKTFAKCLEQEGGDQTKAFSVYNILLSAYDVLLDDEQKNNERMEIEITKLNDYAKYVPYEVIEYLRDKNELPNEVKAVIWSNKFKRS